MLEKSDAPGGLCRSYPFAGMNYDVGPHIMFSKNQEVLDLMVGLLGDNVHKLRRSNKIFHDGRFVKYPFENELSALAPAERDWCLETFLDNPYAHYSPTTMLEFFLATFGEGITNLYLRPYNEKIWKFDPAFMDTQMVDRIPKPPAEDIIRTPRAKRPKATCTNSTSSIPGMAASSRLNRLSRPPGREGEIHVNTGVARIVRDGGRWQVLSPRGRHLRFRSPGFHDPDSQFGRCLGENAPQAVVEAASHLRFNSIAIAIVKFPNDNLGDNFGVNIADKQVLFHRLAKIDFLLPEGEGGRHFHADDRGDFPQGRSSARMSDAGVPRSHRRRLGTARVHRLAADCLVREVAEVPATPTSSTTSITEKT